MATDTAPATTFRPRPAPPRQLWQVPAFLLGVACTLVVTFGRPYLWPADDLAAARRALAKARRALDQVPPDADTALQAGNRALALADKFPQVNAEAHFLAGSARLRMADDSEGLQA